MAIPSNLKTPGVYTEINTQTKRTGLPAQDHKVLLLVSDDSEGAGAGDGGLQTVSTQAQADSISGDKNSSLSRMARAALATTLSLSMQVASASVSGGGSGGLPENCDPDTVSLQNPELDFGDVAYLTLSIDGEPDRVINIDTQADGNTFAFTLFSNLLIDDSNLFARAFSGGTAAFFLDSNLGNYSLFGNSDDGLTPEPHNVVFKPTAGLVAGEVDLAQIVFGLQLGSSLTVHSCALNTIAAS